MILQLLFHLRRPLMLNSRLKTLSLGRGLPNLSPILHIDIHTTHIVAPVIVLYDNSTNMPLPLLSYTVINTANSFVAEPWPFIINDCISDPPTNLRCADTYIWLKRTYITKSIAILSLVVGWLLALMTVVLAVIAWRGPSKESSEDQTKRTRPGRRISENVLLFPIATTLAIPALRSLFPAAPPTGILFGTIDLTLRSIISNFCDRSRWNLSTVTTDIWLWYISVLGCHLSEAKGENRESLNWRCRKRFYTSPRYSAFWLART
ncbi:hypothetical protein FRC18_002928 [Serendipita sp. 400]|nr:hypothetical protein FRC18_002928 [Serendipita sp. 400]